MKQDVTTDGSLHPSKHGTLAELALPPPLTTTPSSFFFVPEQTVTTLLLLLPHYYFSGSVLIILSVQQITAAQCRGTPNWPAYICVQMCLHPQVN